jgi:hypothetical protein
VPEQLQFFNTRKLTYKICLDLSVLHLFLSGALWEEVQCTARVVDGYNAIPGAHRHEAASSSWLTSLFLMVDLPLPHVVVELLLLWSRKELHPAHGNCTCCTDDEDIPLQKPWQLLLLHTIQCMRRAFKVDPNEWKSLLTVEHLKWTQVQSLSQQHHLCISKWHNFRLVLICSQLS